MKKLNYEKLNAFIASDVIKPFYEIRLTRLESAKLSYISKRKNPYLFKQINAYLKYGNYPKILPKTKLKYFFTYLDYAKNYSIKPAQIRMQAMNFSRGCDGGKKLRGDLLGKNTVEEIRAVLENFYCHLE